MEDPLMCYREGLLGKTLDIDPNHFAFQKPLEFFFFHFFFILQLNKEQRCISETKNMIVNISSDDASYLNKRETLSLCQVSLLFLFMDLIKRMQERVEEIKKAVLLAAKKIGRISLKIQSTCSNIKALFVFFTKSESNFLWDFTFVSIHSLTNHCS